MSHKKFLELTSSIPKGIEVLNKVRRVSLTPACLEHELFSGPDPEVSCRNEPAAAEQAQEYDAADGPAAVLRGDILRFAEKETCTRLPHLTLLHITYTTRHSYSIHHAELNL